MASAARSQSARVAVACPHAVASAATSAKAIGRVRRRDIVAVEYARPA
jgi:hypothetical protein